MVGEVPAILDRPHDLPVEFVRPAQRFQVPSVLRDDFSLAEQLAGAGVDGRQRMGALVGISPDHNHPLRPFNRSSRLIGPSADRPHLGAVLTATLLSGHANGSRMVVDDTTGDSQAKSIRPTDRL
jgi:hypothetical protein